MLQPIKESPSLKPFGAKTNFIVVSVVKLTLAMMGILSFYGIIKVFPLYFTHPDFPGAMFFSLLIGLTILGFYFCLNINVATTKREFDYQTDKETRGNLFIVSPISTQKYAHILHIVKIALVFVSIFPITYCLFVTNFSLWIKIPSEVGVTLLIFSSLTLRSVILDKENKTVTIINRLFGLWTVTRKAKDITIYNGIVVHKHLHRSALYSYEVELVGRLGTTLCLKSFQSMEDACDLRDSIAEWLNIKALLDPAYPLPEN